MVRRRAALAHLRRMRRLHRLERRASWVVRMGWRMGGWRRDVLGSEGSR